MPLYIHSSSTCDVCLRNYAADLQPYGIPCGHIFCKDCLARILSTREEQRTINLSTIPARGECPLCRRNYRDLESAKRLRVDILDAIRLSPDNEDQATLERELKEREDDALVRRWLQVHPDDSVALEDLEQRMETREDLRAIVATLKRLRSKEQEEALQRRVAELTSELNQLNDYVHHLESTTVRGVDRKGKGKAPDFPALERADRTDTRTDPISSGLPPKKHKRHRDVTPLDIANDATAVLSARTISNPLPLPPQDIAFDNRHAVPNSFTTPFVPPPLLPLESTPPQPDAELHSDRKRKGPKKTKQTPEEKGEEMKAIIREGIWGTNTAPAVIPHTLPRSTVDLPATSGAHAHSSHSGRARPGPQSPPTPVPPASVFSPPSLATPYLPNGVVPPIPLAMPAQQQNRVVSDPVRSMSETTPRMTKRTSPQAATAPPPPPAPPAVLPMSPPDSTGNLSGISSPQSILTNTPAVSTNSRALPTQSQEPHNPSARASVRTSPPRQAATTNAAPQNGTMQRISPPQAFSAGPSQPVHAATSKPPASRRRQSIDLPAVSAPSLTASTSGERRVRFMENPATSGPQRRQPPTAARRRPHQSTDGYASDSQLDDTTRDLGDGLLSPGSTSGASVMSPSIANAPMSPSALPVSSNSEAVTGLGLDINAPASPAAWAVPTPIRNLDAFLRSFSDGQHLD